MLKKIVCYPKNLATFMEWCNSNMQYKKIYEDLGKPRPFDVSLRDGLQGLQVKDQQFYSTDKKKEIFDKIVIKHKPIAIECGSFVSEKVYPIFKDSLDLYKYAETKNQDCDNNYKYIDNYVFIPSYEKFCDAIKLKCFENFSFVSSASDQFLLKNIKKDFEKNYEELSQIFYLLDGLFSKNFHYKTKIYVSCINECPINGKMDNKIIVNKIAQLNNLQFDTICLSDTCGTLEPQDFEYIVDKCNELGIPYHKLSLHLHVNPLRNDIVEEIIHKALERKITNFDVSILETGGCSVTIDKEKLMPNLSYHLYYKALTKYILKKCENTQL
jgi:hypothetical protein